MANPPTNSLIIGREEGKFRDDMKENELLIKMGLAKPSKISKELMNSLIDFEKLAYCYECGTCTAACPVARIFSKYYNPRTFFQKLSIAPLSILRDTELWLCAMCDRCHKRCPHGLKLPEIFQLLRKLAIESSYAPEAVNKLEEALTILREEIPFPLAYSWLSLRPCEEGQTQDKLDAVVLDILRKSLADYKTMEVEPLPKTRKENIAIIGSGPAGLTAAWELAKMGFPITVFEFLPKPGGMLRVGIPNYRLPKEVLDVEVERIKKLGIEIRTNTRIGKDIPFEDLLKGKYKAVFIATGAHESVKLNIDGEDLAGVVHALDLLREFNLDERPQIGKNVVVVGGGNVAIDTARIALCIGAEEVQLFCLEPRDEMPAHEWEIQDAVEEGVIINATWGPKKILGNGKNVTGVKFIRCVSVFDENGWFNPSYDDTKSKVIEADTVILAIGQRPDLSLFGNKIDVLGSRLIESDPITMETKMPGLFVGGDAATGPATVIEAIAAGKIAAESINRYLSDGDG